MHGVLGMVGPGPEVLSLGREGFRDNEQLTHHAFHIPPVSKAWKIQDPQSPDHLPLTN